MRARAVKSEALRQVSPRSSILVADPGGLPWLRILGSALASAGMLARYITPVGSAQPRLPAITKLLPAGARGRLNTELFKRKLPPELTDHLVQRHSSFLELMRVGSRHLLPSVQLQD